MNVGMTFMGLYEKGKKKNRVKICLVGRMEMWEDKKCFIFPHLCLVGEVEEWRDENLLGLVEKKNKRIKNVVCINLPSCPY